jgi:para-aminobenzoate synthetase / 4-amino-4-deoxychorismate lyase
VTLPPHGLFETMRVEGGEPRRLEAHLGRLGASAAALGVPFDAGRAHSVLREALAAAPAAPVQRLRLDLAPTGALRARVRPHVDESPGARVRVTLSPERLDADHPRQRHKTTDRERYDRASAWARVNGLSDVLFLNGRGMVAEGAISTVFVRRGSRLVTPRVADGALPGVLRAELLASGEAHEAALAREELTGELYLGSALRGLRRAVLVEGPSSPAAA